MPKPKENPAQKKEQILTPLTPMKSAAELHDEEYQYELEQARKQKKNEQSNPTIVNTAPKSKDFDDIVAAFITQFEKKGGKYDKAKNSFEFPTLEQAKVFFKEQAQKNRAFFGRESTPDGKPKPGGYNIFSLGDGQSYEGTLQEIRNKLKAMEDTLEEGNPLKEKYKQAGLTFETLMVKEGLKETKEKAKVVQGEFSPEDDEETNQAKMQ
ncbi:Uncharacterised protein [Legionella busanensis]|uniref:Dot/Icm secretion system substrate n=1 Tax=Legionella busanensis TaxID=190655 RepID=A0A378JJ10_9GAMM|nr:hypothetical protein [Legionella busanensis]STX50678.1 Uncharacterised protein [Legionella busanensis]